MHSPKKTSDNYIYSSILKHIVGENTSESEHRSAHTASVNNGIIIIFNGNNNTIKFSEHIDR